MTYRMNEFFDADARIERLIHIPSATCHEGAYPRDLEEFAECFPEKANDPIFVDLSCLKALLDGDEYPAPEAVATMLLDSRTSGLLVQGAACVSTPLGGGVWQSGWGHYRTRWFYAKDISEAEEKVLTWAAEMHKADMAKKPAA